MSELLIQKPSRIHNLGYYFLGYYISLLITYDLNLPFDQRTALITAFGSFIGTLMYYIKPIERSISFYFRLSKTNKTSLPEIYAELKIPVYKSDVLYSNYLQDERTIINGAFFFAFGIIFSNNVLGSIELSHLYWYLQIFTGLLISVGIWEIYILIKRKLPLVLFLYNYYNISKYIPDLKKAINNKDWIEATKIIEREPELEEPELIYHFSLNDPKKGLCINCKEIREGYHCTECGKHLLKKCSKCKSTIVNTKTSTYAHYCRYCGTKLNNEENKKN